MRNIGSIKIPGLLSINYNTPIEFIPNEEGIREDGKIYSVKEAMDELEIKIKETSTTKDNKRGMIKQSTNKCGIVFQKMGKEIS